MTFEDAPYSPPGAGGNPGFSAAPAVRVSRLVKRYPKSPVNAVDDLSFIVAAGEIFGLLGPNGAGKTTTIRTLTTRAVPTSGTAEVANVDVVANPTRARRRLAVVPQLNNLDRSLTIRTNLLMHAAYHGVPRAERRRRADALLAEMGLRDRAEDRVDRLSGGLAQRVMIARSLMHAPQVVFLDEPSTGLDPAARLFLWDRIRELAARGITVIITTHDMEEAATLTGRVGIVDHGKLLALGSPAELTRNLPGNTTLDMEVGREADTPVDHLIDNLIAINGLERVERVSVGPSAPGGYGGMPGAPPWMPAGMPGANLAGGNPQSEPPDGPPVLHLRLYVTGDAPLLIAPVVSVLTKFNARLLDLTVGKPSLEDVFIQLTGRALR